MDNLILIPIEGNTNYYMDNNLEVWSTAKGGKLRKKKMMITGNGYLGTSFYINKKGKNVLHHRLVALVFMPNPENKPCINHKDGNRANNSIDNLEWCTYSENNKHTYDSSSRKPPYNGLGKTGKLHYKSTPVVQLTMDMEFVREYDSQACAERGSNKYFNQRHVSACCRGARPHHRNFIWMYKEEYIKLKINNNE